MASGVYYGCFCGVEAPKLKTWARRVLGGLAHHGGSKSLAVKAPARKQTCPRCEPSPNRGGMVLEYHPLRQNPPFNDKHAVENAHISFRLALNRYISHRGHPCCRVLSFEVESVVTERVYAQLLLDDSPIIEEVMDICYDGFQRPPSDVFEELNDLIDSQLEQVLRQTMI